MEQENKTIRFSTVHEIRFIENIGLNQFGSDNLYNRKTLLRNYIKAAEKRSYWGSIDKDIVLSTAQKLLGEVAN
ncbi:hypothetical protein [Nitrosomonas sp.]|uniref:hypothetical protein n=1 Tax=Nitrosomonas sp. TaxID=42353 RepID=UPI0025E9D1A2|nr:hypothetical protein [Nitrosomonas sp.]MBY0484591.1 hypothetical protein [Nitrosomonas sp.]